MSLIKRFVGSPQKFREANIGAGSGGAAEGNAAAQPAEGADQSGKQAEPQIKESHISELARRTGVLKNLQAENAKLKSDLDGKSQPVAKTDQGYDPKDPFTHPALKGLQPNDDGTVNFNGTDMTPEVAVMIAEARSDAQTALKSIADGAKGQEEAKYNADLTSARQDIITSTATALSDLFAESHPTLKGDALSEANTDYLERCEKELISLGVKNPEDITPELLGKAADQAKTKLRRLGAIFAEAQITDNQQHAETHKLQPGAKTAGTEAPVDESTLSRGERAKLSAQRSAEAVAKARSAREG